MKIELDIVGRHCDQPLYRQLKEAIQRAILDGVYKPGQRIETEAQFMKQGKLSNRTVGRAFKELVEEGLVVRKPGCGTFVSDLVNKSPGKATQKAIAVVYKDIEDELFVRRFKGIQDECQEHGYGCIPISIGWEDDTAEDRIMRSLENNKVAGILAMPDMSTRSHRELMRLILKRIPVVLMDSYLPEIASDSVLVNNKNAVSELTRHLLDLGHSRITAFSCPINYPYGTSIRERISGMQIALRRAGIDCGDDSVIMLPKDYPHTNAVHDALANLLNRPKTERPTAIVCVHDRLARDVIFGLRDLEIKVPDQISVTGFDDMLFASDFDPPLTTVHQPFEQIGREAAALLFDKFRYPDRQAVRVVLSAPIVKRKSTSFARNPNIQKAPNKVGSK